MRVMQGGFLLADKVVVKSVGVRERIDKLLGKIVKYIGNFYLYFLIKCFIEYDQKFFFSVITVFVRIFIFLFEGGREMLEVKGLFVEK